VAGCRYADGEDHLGCDCSAGGVVLASRSRKIKHPGSAHDEAALEALKAGAQQRIAAGQPELSLGLEPAGGGPLPITSSKMSHLVDSLERARL
jgi:hypothetical protein